jgi:sugar lactone lactonase YvrE
MKGIRRTCFAIVAVIAMLAFAGGCSNWVLGVVQSFGSPNGPKISTVAGNGTAGYMGDSGPATAAELSQPYGVAVDSLGNLYIADSRNNLIRMVNASGTITNIPAVPGLNAPLGIAVDPSSGDIYFSDTSNFVVRRINHSTHVVTIVAGMINSPGYTGDGGPPTSAKLDYPYGVAVDSSGNVYIAQMSNYSVVRKVNAAGTIISTVAGKIIANGSPGFTGDGGPATSANLNYPQGVAVDSVGNLYIADSSNYVIRKVDYATQNISTIAGTGISGYSGDGGPATAAQINWPNGLAVDSTGNLYITEGDNIVRKVDTSGNISTVAGNVHLVGGYGGDGNVATAATLYNPWGLAFDSFGNLLIGDRLNNRIRKVGMGQ